jgi:hypothetical protein
MSFDPTIVRRRDFQFPIQDKFTASMFRLELADSLSARAARGIGALHSERGAKDETHGKSLGVEVLRELRRQWET